MPETFKSLAYDSTIIKLVFDLGYPSKLLKWTFDWEYMVMGLVLDKKRGNIFEGWLKKAFLVVDLGKMSSQMWHSKWPEGVYDDCDEYLEVKFGAKFLFLNPLMVSTIIRRIKGGGVRESFHTGYLLELVSVAIGEGQYEAIDQRKDHYKGLVSVGGLVFEDSDSEDDVPKILKVPSGMEVVDDLVMVNFDDLHPKEILDVLASEVLSKVDDVVSPPVV
ncbi:hypothetical protein GIB67_020855 [Kingdonia uniflora]|uniref:Uncharacterized protein n=1 Tax=Kingdonia uniflora TaxID=39325 RepID=A0A7J7M7E8_9MAGN|nr:hypothetical protein GIB67_020855 [Kingdonia uniflora]